MLDALWTAGVRAHRGLYARGWLRRAELGGRVIAVGALRAGGSGKSPIARLLAAEAAARGPAALLLRGPGGAPRLAWPGPGVQDEVGCWGDEGVEAVEAARRLPRDVGERLRVVVGADRAAGAARWAPGAARIVLDDGWTHWRVAPDAVVVAVGPGDAGQRALPCGPLRLTLREVPTEATLWYHDGGCLGVPGPPTGRLDEALYARAQVRSGVAVEAWRAGGVTRWDELGDCLLICATGAPQRVVMAARRAGAQVAEVARFGDHHRFTRDEIAALAAKGLPLLTTSKDAPRLFTAAPELREEVAVLRLRLCVAGGLGAILDGGPGGASPWPPEAA